MAVNRENYRHSNIGAIHNAFVDNIRLRAVLARNVERRMSDAKLKQEDLEERGGLGQATISAILNRKGDATLRSIAGLAKALKCQPWELLVDDQATREFYLRKLMGG